MGSFIRVLICAGTVGNGTTVFYGSVVTRIGRKLLCMQKNLRPCTQLDINLEVYYISHFIRLHCEHLSEGVSERTILYLKISIFEE